MNRHHLLTQHMAQKNPDFRPFTLFDVGASGGIDERWYSFGSFLQATGFDPLISEVERLNRLSTSSNVKYWPYLVVSEDETIDVDVEPECFGTHLDMFDRSSSYKYMKNCNIDPRIERYNRGKPLIYSNQKMSLDRFCRENNIDEVNFIKIDTDGSDYKVISGAKNLLKNDHLLGLAVECYFNNSDPHSSTFRNLDRVLVEAGFTLFNLSTYNFTRKDLPGQFLYTIPAQTVSGPVFFGDALYLRDFVSIKTKNESKHLPTHLLVQMACLQEILGLPDCAAELMIAYRDQLSTLVNVDHCLDLLAQDVELFSSYKEHMEAFARGDDIFFPSKSKNLALGSLGKIVKRCIGSKLIKWIDMHFPKIAKISRLILFKNKVEVQL